MTDYGYFLHSKCRSDRCDIAEKLILFMKNLKKKITHQHSNAITIIIINDETYRGWNNEIDAIFNRLIAAPRLIISCTDAALASILFFFLSFHSEPIIHVYGFIGRKMPLFPVNFDLQINFCFHSQFFLHFI